MSIQRHVNRMANPSKYPLYGKWEVYYDNGYFYADTLELLVEGIRDYEKEKEIQNAKSSIQIKQTE